MKNKNLLENVRWNSWSPRNELSPEFFIKDDKISISANNNPNVYGKFISDEIFISGCKTLIFEAEFSCRNVKNKEKSIFAIISFYDNNKILLERDYADIIEDSGKKARKLYRKLDAPDTAAYAIIETGTRWCPGALVEWSGIILETAEAAPHRIARIAVTYKEPQDTPAKNLSSIIDIIDKAGKSNPDVILLSELVYESHCGIDLEKIAQPVPGYLTDTIGGYARKYNTYIIFTMNEKDGEVIFNTAVVIGRDGKLCGKYRKIHLPLNEAESGTSPGSTHGIFDLDFGRIGIQICYDQMFPENSRMLALMGAEIIFIPTMGEEEILQKAIARSNGVYVAVSGYEGAASSRIINPLGETVNFVRDKNTAYAVEEIDLNKRFFVYWMSVGAANGETKALFQKERMTETYCAIAQESYKARQK